MALRTSSLAAAAPMAGSRSNEKPVMANSARAAPAMPCEHRDDPKEVWAMGHCICFPNASQCCYSADCRVLRRRRSVVEERAHDDDGAGFDLR